MSRIESNIPINNTKTDKYVEIAMHNGFFQNRTANNRYGTSNEWFVESWINELGSKRDDLDTYLGEILPSFRRWLDNGVSTFGVGANYDLIKAIENSGIEINNGSIGFILTLSRKYREKGIDIDENVINDIVNKLEMYKNIGKDINYKLADTFEISSGKKTN